MSKKILMEITEDHLNTGLRGIPVGYCYTSKVDPTEGLFYRDIPIKDLVQESCESVIYLLMQGEIPKPEALADFKETLSHNMHLDQKVIDYVKGLPKAADPMKAFLTALSLMGTVHSTGNYYKDCLFIIANIPTLVGCLLRSQFGWGDVIKADPTKGYIENFVHVLSPPEATEDLTELLRIFEILHLDHGGGNLSTFVGKAIASGHADMYESLIGAMAGLSGPLHGRANQVCLDFLKQMLGVVEDPHDTAKVEAYLQDIWAKGGKVYGFGHAVLRVEDPRATIQYELGEKIASHEPLFTLAKTVRQVGTAFLKTKEKIANPYPNVDAVSGALLHAVGLKENSYYTVLFGMSRCVGIAVQILYERIYARGGKGSPLIRPKYFYKSIPPHSLKTVY